MFRKKKSFLIKDILIGSQCQHTDCPELVVNDDDDEDSRHPLLLRQQQQQHPHQPILWPTVQNEWSTSMCHMFITQVYHLALVYTYRCITVGTRAPALWAILCSSSVGGHKSTPIGR